MKEENAPVHQLDHAEPTVIHHPDEDMTILARWLQRGVEQGPRFWLWVGGTALGLVALSVIVGGLIAGKATETDAWAEATQAKTVEERVKVAEAHPNTPLAGWAKLMSAQEEYANGIEDLTTPGKKELAGPRLKKALDLFRAVAQEAGKDTSQALGGFYGAARTLEARNELPQAIEQYKKVAERFPDTPEANHSLEMVKALEEPMNQMFYKELYAYTPPATPTLGPGPGALGGPGSLLNPPDLFGGAPKATPTTPAMTPPAGLDAPPPSTPAAPPLEAPRAEPAKKDEAPKAEVPKAELPANPFAPPK